MRRAFASLDALVPGSYTPPGSPGGTTTPSTTMFQRRRPFPFVRGESNASLNSTEPRPSSAQADSYYETTSDEDGPQRRSGSTTRRDSDMSESMYVVPTSSFAASATPMIPTSSLPSLTQAGPAAVPAHDMGGLRFTLQTWLVRVFDVVVGENEQREGLSSATILFRRRGERFVYATAVASRALVALCGSLSVNFVGHYDSSNKLFVGDTSPVMYPLHCAANWDGVYYVTYAEKGYTYEQTHAFFPLYSLATRVFARLLRPFVPTSVYQGSEVALLTLSGALISNIFFVASALLLFRLGERTLGDPTLALRAAILFCFNPASVFFSAAYSESLFCFLSLLGMTILSPPSSHKGDAWASAPSFKARMVASACFGLATATRSNGSTLGLFSLFAAYQAHRSAVLEAGSSPAEVWRVRGRALLELSCVTAIHLAGLLAVLGHGYYRFCTDETTGYRPVWCDYRVPNIYTYIEDHYWHVRPFHYYTAKQIPNFVLATPVLVLGVEAVLHFGRYVPAHSLHLLVGMTVAVVVMHVQVATRFLCSSSPAIFWFAAVVTSKRNGFSYMTLVYFALYALLGSAMFCSFYPWT